MIRDRFDIKAFYVSHIERPHRSFNSNAVLVVSFFRLYGQLDSSFFSVLLPLTQSQTNCL